MSSRKKLVQLVLFAMYGALMFVSKLMMEGLPNIHPLTMFIMTFSLVYGYKALIPTYVYVFLNGLYGGFNAWWIPYLYIWALQCIVTCLVCALIRRIKSGKVRKGVSCTVYPLLAALFGLSFGALYAPAQAIMYNFTFDLTVKWIIAGLYFDIIHAVGNFCMCFLIFPLASVLQKLHAAARIPV